MGADDQSDYEADYERQTRTSDPSITIVHTITHPLSFTDFQSGQSQSLPSDILLYLYYYLSPSSIHLLLWIPYMLQLIL